MTNTTEPTTAIPAIDMAVVRETVRRLGYLHDPRLGWVRRMGFGTIVVTTVIERLGGNPRQLRLREAVKEALGMLHDNPPDAA